MIDPGNNFMVSGNQLEDVARFIFSVTEVFRLRPVTAARLINKFYEGYSSSAPVDFLDLKATIDFRKKRSLEKYRLQKSPFRAFLGSIILKYNRLIIGYSKVLTNVNYSYSSFRGRLLDEYAYDQCNNGQNGEKYLKSAVESILQQSEPNFEFLIMMTVRVTNQTKY